MHYLSGGNIPRYIFGVSVCRRCFVPLLTPRALICLVMSRSVDGSSVTSGTGSVISDTDLRDRQ